MSKTLSETVAAAIEELTNPPHGELVIPIALLADFLEAVALEINALRKDVEDLKARPA